MRGALLFTTVVLVTACHDAVAREWVDRTGRYKTEAEFVELKDGKAVLKRSDGKTVSVPLEKPSVKDRRYIRKLIEQQSAAPVEDTSGEADPAAGAPLQGTLFGQAFIAPVIKIEQDQIEFKSEDEMFPAQSVLLFLFTEGEPLAGQKFTVVPKRFGMNPHIHLKSRQPSKTEIVMDGYTMKLSFGRPKGRQLGGQIDLRIPEQQTTLSGSFVAKEAKNYKLPPTEEDLPYIVATINTPRSTSEEAFVRAGYFGVTHEGKQIANGAGMPWRGGGSVSSTTFEPRVTSAIADGRVLKAQHVVLEPGMYFHYVIWDHSYWTGEFVELSGDAQIETSLEMDLNNCGSLVVETSTDDKVRLVPGDILEATSPMKTQARSVAFRLGIEAEPEGGRAEFTQLRPGEYIVVTNDEEQTVEVRAGEAATVQFEPK